MTSKEKQNENLNEWISGIFGRISNGYPLQRSEYNFFGCRLIWWIICRALQWVPMIFFPKIPEIGLRRFSLQFSSRVVVAILEKFKKFQNISIEDFSENLQYFEKRFQCDNAVYKNKCRNNEAFSRYASYHWVFSLRRDIYTQWVPVGFHGFPIFKWVTHGRLMQRSYYLL
jgi:hypothetical protein